MDLEHSKTGSNAERPIVYIGAGTNVGDRRANLAGALDALARLGTIDAISNVYESEPVGYADQPVFWNLVVRLRTTLRPFDVRAALEAAELRLGRQPTFPNGPRIIDLDLLLYGDQRIDAAELEVPHPRMMERAFVLRPLAELDPELRHPVTGERVADRLARGTFERAVPIFPGSELLPDRPPRSSAAEGMRQSSMSNAERGRTAGRTSHSARHRGEG